jgi:DnaD/phage-associated family protein
VLNRPNLVQAPPGEEARRFAGFPPGRLAFTSVPDLFFSELLPAIDDLAELKVTMHVIWLTQRRRRQPRWVSLVDLAHDSLLMQGLACLPGEPRDVLEEALRKAEARGALLCVRAEGSDGAWYVVNSASGRETMAALRRGEICLPSGAVPAEERPLPVKRGIFSLYEQNVGPLQPIIAEELEQAQQAYPEDWVEEAFRIAAENNVRSWRYIGAILERWQRQGRDSQGRGERERGKRYVTGEYEQYRQL